MLQSLSFIDRHVKPLSYPLLLVPTPEILSGNSTSGCLIHSQVMRNPALEWQRGLCAAQLRFIWSAVPAQACDSFKVLRHVGHLRDWSQRIALALQMNWSPRSPELSATHIVWELHSSTHFSLWAATSEKKEKKSERNVAKLFFFWCAEYVARWWPVAMYLRLGV